MPATTDSPDELAVAYLDQHLIIVVKSAGLLSVPGRSTDKHDCLHSRVQVQFPDLLIVHRLDRDTSGLMLLARTPNIQRELARLFEQRQVHKEYVARVHGQLSDEAGEIDEPIARVAGCSLPPGSTRRERQLSSYLQDGQQRLSVGPVPAG